MTFFCLADLLQLSMSLVRVAHRIMGEGLIWGAWVLWRKCLSLPQQQGTVQIFQERFGLRTPFPFLNVWESIHNKTVPRFCLLQEDWRGQFEVKVPRLGVMWLLSPRLGSWDGDCMSSSTQWGYSQNPTFTELLHPSVDLYPALKTTAGRFSAFADIDWNEVRAQIINLVFTNYEINEVSFRKNNEPRMRLLF